MDANQINQLIEQADNYYNQENYAEALHIYKTLSDENVNYACVMLGMMYEEGFGVAVNYNEAVKYYKLAADKSNAAAAARLGSMYEQGKGVKQNWCEAVRYYKEGAEGGSMVGMNKYALLLQQGRGVQKSISKAYYYFQQSAALGYENSQRSLQYLKNKYKFREDGTIDLEKTKRSKWVIVALIYVLFQLGIWIYGAVSMYSSSMAMSPDFEILNNEVSVLSFLQLILIVASVVLILFKKKLGGKLLLISMLGFLISCVALSWGDALFFILSHFSILLFLVLQIRRDGVPAWNVLMDIPYDGRGVFSKLFYFFTAFGEGEEYRVTSASTKSCFVILKITTAILFAAAITCIVMIFVHGVNVFYEVNWNYFTSPLAGPLAFIGFFLGLKMKTSTYVTGYKDKDGNVYRSADVIDYTTDTILYPLIERFILIPLIFGAAMYYIIMVFVYLLSAILPYVSAAIIVASPMLFYIRSNRALIGRKYRKALIPAFALLFLFGYLTIYGALTI